MKNCRGGGGRPGKYFSDHDLNIRLTIACQQFFKTTKTLFQMIFQKAKKKSILFFYTIFFFFGPIQIAINYSGGPSRNENRSIRKLLKTIFFGTYVCVSRKKGQPMIKKM